MNIYIAKRTPKLSITVSDGKKTVLLRHVKYHSQTFEWGYSGSGPADTALSILAHHFGEKPTKKKLYAGDYKCWQLHQQFKRKFIASAPLLGGFTITSRDIDNWLNTRNGE